jgi:uncharacterized protein with GYD domain
MGTYIILTRLGTESFTSPQQFRELAERVAMRIRTELPKVHWRDSYALMGQYDVVDVVESESPTDVERAAMIIRAEAHATTETLHATPWAEFLKRL